LPTTSARDVRSPAGTEPASDGAASPLPAGSFDELPLSDELRAALRDLNYFVPTPVQLAVWEVDTFENGMARRAVLDDAASDEGQPGLAGGGHRVGIRHDRVVHEVGDRPAAVTVQPVREHAEHVGLEVELEEPTDDVLVSELVPQQEAWRFERATGEDDVTGRHLVGFEQTVEIANTARATAGAVEQHIGDHTLVADLTVARAQRVAQRRDRIALRFDRAPEVSAESAVVARRAVVVLHAVDTSGRAIRMKAQAGEVGGKARLRASDTKVGHQRKPYRTGERDGAQLSRFHQGERRCHAGDPGAQSANHRADLPGRLRDRA
jgi:hypothetical protein